MPRYPQAILVSCEIPWDENENLMEDLFRQEVRHTLKAGFKYVYIFGTAGEGYAVDDRRFQQIVQVFHEETRVEGVTPQVGVIGLSTLQIRQRIAFAHKVGFRAFQISMPSWGVLNDSEAMRFFTEICGAFPDSKFLNYNLMRTKRLLTGADYRRIADAVPNLVATKNTAPNVSNVTDLMRNAPDLQHFFGELTFPLGCLWGECSLLSSFGPMLPKKTFEFFDYGRTGQIEKLFRMMKSYNDLTDDVLSPMMRQPSRIDGAYDKMLVRLGGLPMPLRLLSPYDYFSDDVYEQCRKILHEKYADWLG